MGSGRGELGLVPGDFAADTAVTVTRCRDGKVALRLTAGCSGQVTMSCAALL